eukprot:CAMPEP_0114270628 /NCGR_PEP_ID=MMETSP0058-20121206/27355_1 /TAXON_ID=36894 /ORGANISM="Pyramimonas parkeae, CCMP726" /LENGTH=780 /DNA_ID=CAMNT_0001389409 /DNA_START=154 /DNA_END=2496 /DNA_ORIENTATION=+
MPLNARYNLGLTDLSPLKRRVVEVSESGENKAAENSGSTSMSRTRPPSAPNIGNNLNRSRSTRPASATRLRPKSAAYVERNEHTNSAKEVAWDRNNETSRRNKFKQEVACRGRIYPEGLLPGVNFFQFLAVPSEDYCGTANPKVAVPALQLLIAPTVVCEGDERTLYRTDGRGFVRRVEDPDYIDLLHILAGEQAHRQPHHGAAVYKVPSRVRGAPATSVMPLRYNALKEVLTERRQPASGTYALQQYINCNGPKASVVRVFWRAGRQPSGAYVISNTKSKASQAACARVFQEARCAEDLLDNLHWFVDTEVPLSCNVYAMSPPAWTHLERSTNAIVDFVHRRHPGVRARFSELVADYLKGEDGEWYLLQIKAFKCHAPEQAAGPLSPRSRERQRQTRPRDAEGAQGGRARPHSASVAPGRAPSSSIPATLRPRSAVGRLGSAHSPGRCFSGQLREGGASIASNGEDNSANINNNNNNNNNSNNNSSVGTEGVSAGFVANSRLHDGSAPASPEARTSRTSRVGHERAQAEGAASSRSYAVPKVSNSVRKGCRGDYCHTISRGEAAEAMHRGTAFLRHGQQVQRWDDLPSDLMPGLTSKWVARAELIDLMPRSNGETYTISMKSILQDRQEKAHEELPTWYFQYYGEWVPYDQQDMDCIEAGLKAGKSLIPIPELNLYVNLRAMQQYPPMQPEAAVPIIRIPSHASTGKQYDTARVKNIPYGVLKSKAYDSVPVCYDCYRMYLYKDQQRMMQRLQITDKAEDGYVVPDTERVLPFDYFDDE